MAFSALCAPGTCSSIVPSRRPLATGSKAYPPPPVTVQALEADVGVLGQAVGPHVDAGRGARCRRAGASPGRRRRPRGSRRASIRSAEGDEGRVDRLRGAVVVEVVGLDVRHDRGVRAVEQERAVALVGLGHEHVAAAVVGVRAGLVEAAADREGRVRPAVLQGDREHRGRRGLAVGAGDRDGAAPGHHRGQRRGARQHQAAGGAGRGQFGVGLPDRGGDHDGVGIADLLGLVPDVHPGAERAQRGQRGGVLGVAAGDGDAAGQQDPRDAGHAGPADADEVHPAELVGRRDLLRDGDHVAPPSRSCCRNRCPALRAPGRPAPRRRPGARARPRPHPSRSPGRGRRPAGRRSR